MKGEKIMSELDLIKYLLSRVGLQFFKHTLKTPPQKDETITTAPFKDVPTEIEQIIIKMLIQKENIQFYQPTGQLALILEMINSTLSTFLRIIAPPGTIVLNPDDLLIAVEVEDEAWDPLEYPFPLPNPEHYVLGVSSYALDYDFEEDDDPSIDVDG